MENKSNKLRYPTKKFMQLMFALWIAVTLITIVVKTDFFKENPFNGKFRLSDFIHFAPTFLMLVVVGNYFKNKRKADQVN